MWSSVEAECAEGRPVRAQSADHAAVLDPSAVGRAGRRHLGVLPVVAPSRVRWPYSIARNHAGRSKCAVQFISCPLRFDSMCATGNDAKCGFACHTAS